MHRASDCCLRASFHPTPVPANSTIVVVGLVFIFLLYPVIVTAQFLGADVKVNAELPGDVQNEVSLALQPGGDEMDRFVLEEHARDAPGRSSLFRRQHGRVDISLSRQSVSSRIGDDALRRDPGSPLRQPRLAPLAGVQRDLGISAVEPTVAGPARLGPCLTTLEAGIADGER